MFGFTFGGSDYREEHDIVSKAVVDRLPKTMSQLEIYAGDALVIRETIVLKMRNMTDDGVEGLPRPVFRQDEWKLIVVGALLGGLVGELQVLLVEHLAR